MIPNFYDTELALAAELLARRYGDAISFECAEAEIALDAGRDATTACPALYWEARGAQFVVCKTGEGRYRGQFFEGEGVPAELAAREFVDLGDCVTSLLRVQSDHERALRSGA
jgi:hypothetical protein